MVTRIFVLVRKKKRAAAANESNEPNRVDVGGHQNQDNYSDDSATARAVSSHSKSSDHKIAEGDKEVESRQQQQFTSEASGKRPPRQIIYTAGEKASKKHNRMVSSAAAECEDPSREYQALCSLCCVPQVFFCL